MRKLLICLAAAVLLFSAVPASALKGVEIPDGAANLDLSFLKSLSEKDAASLAELLSAHPDVVSCDLSAVRLSLKAAASLAEACPSVRFHFTLDLEGKKVDSLERELDLDGLKLSQKLKIYQVRRVLACMPLVETVRMRKARFLLKDMEPLIAEFPAVSFDFRVRVDGVNYGTDDKGVVHEPMGFWPGATAFSTLKGRQDPRYTAEDMTPVIRWCPDLLALDLGHNNVSDLSFLTAWPHLRRLIVVDSKVPVTDLSPLAGLDDLEYVELFMQDISDVSPLAGKTKLLDLNLCHNRITDLSPLYSCVNLERLWISYNEGLTQEEIDRFREALPSCRVESEEYQSTGAGWREHPRYPVVVKSFETGIYLPFETEQEAP